MAATIWPCKTKGSESSFVYAFPNLFFDIYNQQILYPCVPGSLTKQVCCIEIFMYDMSSMLQGPLHVIPLFPSMSFSPRSRQYFGI